jgi:Seryl-tRNA synthetase
MTPIDWRRLADALEFYKAAGFIEVGVDWHVSPGIHQITCTNPSRMFHLKEYGVLVGSAEQAFIGMQLEGRLGPGRYVALTPCFRDEGAEGDDLHGLYFAKVELYSTLPHPERELMALHAFAATFMWGQCNQQIDTVPTEEGLDLEIGGVEVGSYSSRSFRGISWTCGTGLAEPRFSMACARS